ncbi:ALK and LTK ligand 2b [Astyanax mexicanus]|uniref:ALK and LTK ligand 2 n=1 Tax=Astyanax mexicanus TaxID=7994 RepID=A0A8B9HB96_ASTMX|nr:ALK and LTK ligand 2b [Astyanax mexicanus]XP_049319130.1 ALK and LTK ligand 2b [Astyanax mexicanus]KAG9269828.1 protein FAM150B [Astyanax mexicanus]
MLAPRVPLVMALVLLVLSQRVSGRPKQDENGEECTRCRDSLITRITQSTSEKQNKLVEENEDVHRTRHRLKTETGEQILEIFPRDLRKKEKFLKHLTGPLYFSPKCRKHVYRLYHNTRDCTIPAYYKRCARLLTRLAGSPRCLES